MCLSIVEAEDLAKKISVFEQNLVGDITLFPSFVHLERVSKILEGTAFKLGAQDVAYSDSPAMTGEISTSMLKELGCEWVIVGHSERRYEIRERDSFFAKKLMRSLDQGLSVVLCVGEQWKDREEQKAKSVIRTQLEGSLGGRSDWPWDRLVIAYEPVWAIGTGHVATLEDVNSMHQTIKEWLSSRYDSCSSLDDARLIYGGSVKPENVCSLASSEWIHGALVGGASLNASSFMQIIEASWNK